MDDLETASLKAQIEYLRTILGRDAAVARGKANAPGLGDLAIHQCGYADALDRVVAALRTLEEQW